jgi:hypothetical protein
MYLNQRVAEFSFFTPSAPPLTYTFKLHRTWLAAERQLTVLGVICRANPLARSANALAGIVRRRRPKPEGGAMDRAFSSIDEVELTARLCPPPVGCEVLCRYPLDYLAVWP